MKNILKTIRTQVARSITVVFYTLISTLYLSLSFNPIAHAAASATLSLSPGTGSVTNGSSISFTINVNAGSNHITGAQACVTYDTSKLTLSNVDTSSSALGSTSPGSTADCSSGEIQVARFDYNPANGTIAPASGTFTLAVLTFTAKAGGTTATLAFDNAKSYIKDDATTDPNTGNYLSILTGSTGSTLTLNNIPAPPPSPAPVTPPATNTNPGGQTTPKPATPKNQAPITDTSHTTTPASPLTTPAQAASEDTKVAPVTDKAASASGAAKKAASHKVTYIVSGAIVVALIAAGLMIKFIGAPGLPTFGTQSVHVGPGDVPTVPTSPTTPTPTLSNIPDPELPTPSSVVKPTEPPSSSSNDEQKPL